MTPAGQPPHAPSGGTHRPVGWAAPPRTPQPLPRTASPGFFRSGGAPPLPLPKAAAAVRTTDWNCRYGAGRLPTSLPCLSAREEAGPPLESFTLSSFCLSHLSPGSWGSAARAPSLSSATPLRLQWGSVQSPLPHQTPPAGHHWAVLRLLLSFLSPSSSTWCFWELTPHRGGLPRAHSPQCPWVRPAPQAQRIGRDCHRVQQATHAANPSLAPS